MTTMREVAAAAGVSAKTVSRVFNDDPHVTPETRARVEVALRQLNYVPNAVATTFRTGRSPVVGIAVPDIVDPFFAAIAKSVGRLATQHGMSTVVTSLGEDMQKEADVVGRLLSQSLSGLIIAPVAAEHAYLEPWKDRLPIVFVDRRPVRLAADSFTEDDQRRRASWPRGTSSSTVTGASRSSATPPTCPPATAGCSATGPRSPRPGSGRTPTTRCTARSTGTAPPGCCASSWSSPSRRRRSCPPTPAPRWRSCPPCASTALAIVGFGDFPMADMLDPAMTVIDQDPYALGTLAAQRVFDRLGAPGAPVPPSHGAARHPRGAGVLPLGRR